MRRFTYLTLFLGLFFFAAPTVANAQYFGLRGGFDLEIEDAFLGVEARFGGPNIAIPISIQPAIEYYFVGGDDRLGVDVNQTLIVGEVNALYSFGVENTYFTPYFGAGVNVVYSAVEVGTLDESDTAFGLGLVGGALFGGGNLRPFAQARVGLTGDYDLVTLMGGVLFRFGQ